MREIGTLNTNMIEGAITNIFANYSELGFLGRFRVLIDLLKKNFFCSPIFGVFWSLTGDGGDLAYHFEDQNCRALRDLSNCWAYFFEYFLSTVLARV